MSEINNPMEKRNPIVVLLHALAHEANDLAALYMIPSTTGERDSRLRDFTDLSFALLAKIQRASHQENEIEMDSRHDF